MRARVAWLTLALVAPPLCARADSFDPISIGVHAGTLGYGLTLERPLLFDLSARVVTGSLSNSQEAVYDGNPWTSTFRARNVLTALDWRPRGGRFRLSGGLLFGRDQIKLAARDYGGFYRINGTVYDMTQAGAVGARLRFDRPGIYAGAGVGTGIVPGLKITFDAGIVVRNGTVTTTSDGPLRGTPGFEGDLAALRGRFRTRIVSPVIGVGLTYRP